MSKEKTEEKWVRITCEECLPIHNALGKVISEHQADTCIKPSLRVLILKKKMQDENGGYEILVKPNFSVVVNFVNDEQTKVTYAGVRFDAIVTDYIPKSEPFLNNKQYAHRGAPQR